ncbi:MAG: DASS family sodium-coupled anion symporter [Candidatus Micrarchaeota archaeon]
MEDVRLPGLLVSALIAVALLALPIGLDWKAHAVLSIAAFMGACWFTEALPLHVTALFGTFLLIVSGALSAEEAFSGYFNPTIALFFGGLVLALAMQDHGVDMKIASLFMGLFGGAPDRFILGMMVATAFLSLWISNTATAAIMIPVALFTVPASEKAGPAYRKAAVIAVAFSATIGGMGTLVGTPPNAIAAAELAAEGLEVTFVDWALHGMPIVALLIPCSWLVIMHLHRPDIKKVVFKSAKGGWTGKQAATLAIGAFTVLLWMTSSIHRIPDGASSILAVVLLYASNLVKKDGISRIDWGVLMLLGGSIALGSAIGSSGLSDIVGGMLSDAITGQSGSMVYLAVLAFGSAITAGMSNTSTAALIVPIVASLQDLSVGMEELVILAGLASSLNFISPAGTPPTAMAFYQGRLSVWDLVKVGIPITLIGLAISALVATFLW